LPELLEREGYAILGNVFHIEYAAADLPGGLEWHGRYSCEAEEASVSS